jgi:hypothetical protein
MRRCGAVGRPLRPSGQTVCRARPKPLFVLVVCLPVDDRLPRERVRRTRRCDRQEVV